MKKFLKYVLFFFLFVFITVNALMFTISYLKNRDNDYPEFKDHFYDKSYDSDSLGTLGHFSQWYEKVSEDTVMFKAYMRGRNRKLIADGYIVKGEAGAWIYTKENYDYRLFKNHINVDSLMVRFIDGSACCDL